MEVELASKSPTKDGSPWWERAAITCLGASMTGPMYFLMYCMGWLEQHQGKSIVLEMFTTFYPTALCILLIQVSFDHAIDAFFGRRIVTILRFGACAACNFFFLPSIWFFIEDKISLWCTFAILGFAHGAMLGSSFELCLDMPRKCKGIEYLNVGLQVGGVAEGIFGVISNFTLHERPNSYHFFVFAGLTSLLAAAGFASVILLHAYSPNYAKVMQRMPEPPPSSFKDIADFTYQLRVSVIATILTSGSTLVCNGFYTYAPTSTRKDPQDNATLVVLLVYVNLFSDLIGRTLTTHFVCPSSGTLLQLASGRLLLAFGFFAYIYQTQWLNDLAILLLLHVLMVSHGMITTWSFVHAKTHSGVGGVNSAFVSKFCVITLFVAILIGTFTGNVLERLLFPSAH